MKLLELQEKQKKEGYIGRKDLAKNVINHFDTEIEDFCIVNKLAINDAVQIYSPVPEDSNRPVNATEDLCKYLGVRTGDEGNVPSSLVVDVLPPDSGGKTAKGLATIAHFNQVFDDSMFTGVPTLDGKGNRIDSALSRSDLNKAFNPDTVLPMEVTRQIALRLRLANVVAGRIPVTGDSGIVPILKSSEKVGGQGTANRRLPRYSMETDEKPLQLTEDGFEVEISDATRRSSAATVGAISEDIRQKSELFEAAIVNAILNQIGTGIGSDYTLSWSSATGKDMMELHMMLNDIYMLTTFFGTLKGIVEYLAIDPTYTSDTQRPATPDLRRTMIVDQMLGRETVAKRDVADVPALGNDNNAKVFCGYDRTKSYNFYTERGGSLNDTYREEADRVQVIRMVMSYGGRKRAEIDNCRVKVTIG